jgi:hypothetical protein
MTGQPNGVPKHDPNVYRQNRNRRTLDELLPYQDQWVVWSADGTRMVAHHADPMIATGEVLARGIDPEDVVVEYIPPLGESLL